ncbi:MAG TPA: autoinducer binding domain-containing protein [Hyphomicrobiales bacterium]|nr:autoinducer binding domain-containing protein [Hyphomicrobiales bacterium]
MEAATVSFDFIAAFRRARSAAQVLTQLERAGSAFDFDHVCMSGVSSTVPPWAPPGFVHRWPAGWYRRYLDRGYLRRDPIARAVLTTTRPFAWDEIEVPPEDVAAAEFMADAASFGLAAGFCVPIYQVGRVTAVSFGGKRRAGLTEDDRGALQLIALFALPGHANCSVATPTLKCRRRNCASPVARRKSCNGLPRE